MDTLPFRKQTLVAYARNEAFAIGTLGILDRLGYSIVTPDQFEELAEAADPGEPLRAAGHIVDERRLGEVPDDSDHASLPIVLLTGRHGTTGADSRIVAAVKRPAGLHDLYQVLQQVLEDVPRSTPRVATHLKCVCRRRDQEFPSTVLSLSENGALLRSLEPLPLGSDVELCVSLPGAGDIRIAGDTAYQLPPDIGVVFSSVPPTERRAIQDFIVRTLS